MKAKAPKPLPPRNWVAKHMNTFCRAKKFTDKKRDYQRTPKHRSRDFGVNFCQFDLS